MELNPINDYVQGTILKPNNVNFDISTTEICSSYQGTKIGLYVEENTCIPGF